MLLLHPVFHFFALKADFSGFSRYTNHWFIAKEKNECSVMDPAALFKGML